MFDDLDMVLEKLLGDAAAPATLRGANVSFVPPTKTFAPTPPTVDLFLYQVAENRELRDPEPITRNIGNTFVRRTPPLRVDCKYLVTIWPDTAGANPAADEHRLLGHALYWLSRFPVIPQRFLQGTGLQDQPFPPPTLAAQLEDATKVSEFWIALGIAPRPFFNLIVTIAMDLNQALEDSIVTTVSTRYHAGDPAAAEERMILGGTVRDPQARPVADAWVRLEPAGLTQVTDGAGRFIFTDVARGGGMTLRARAPGLGETTRSPVEIPAMTRDYDLNFS